MKSFLRPATAQIPAIYCKESYSLYIIAEMRDFCKPSFQSRQPIACRFVKHFEQDRGRRIKRKEKKKRRRGIHWGRGNGEVA